MEPAPAIELEDAVEGEGQVLSKDFFFDRIGLPLPVVRRGGGDGDVRPYHPERLPCQPLAICDLSQLVFVAHSSGFCAADINTVIEEAKKWAEIGNGRSVQELSLVDVPVGPVRLLSLSPLSPDPLSPDRLSPDSSTLAASVGGTVNFFSVHSLRNGSQEPFFSCSIDEGSSVKDMGWRKPTPNSYLLLTSCGNLYLGSIGEPLQLLMGNVDAVDCSANNDYVAVARNNNLSILSPGLNGLNEVCGIALSLQPWTVDSLKWVRGNCIILGCFQLTSNGREESYLLLVIKTGDGESFHAHSFHDVFPQIVEDIMPAESGPHLFFSNVKRGNFAIAANRKNVDQHIVLFDQSSDKPMVLVDINRDDRLPRIFLQENGDDNSILGLCIERDSTEFRFRSRALNLPHVQGRQFWFYCNLWCLTLEGKLVIFDVGGNRQPYQPEDNFAEFRPEYQYGEQ